MTSVSHWANYARERFGWSALESDRGTVLYSIRPPFARIEEMHIPATERLNGAGAAFVDQIAELGKAQGCTHVWGQIATGALNASEAMLAALRVGFKIAASDTERIIIIKEIGD